MNEFAQSHASKQLHQTMCGDTQSARKITCSISTQNVEKEGPGINVHSSDSKQYHRACTCLSNRKTILLQLCRSAEHPAVPSALLHFKQMQTKLTTNERQRRSIKARKHTKGFKSASVNLEISDTETVIIVCSVIAAVIVIIIIIIVICLLKHKIKGLQNQSVGPETSSVKQETSQITS